MYGLAKDFDYSIFSEKLLEMICFAAYSINLHFGEELSISLGSSYEQFSSSSDSDGPVTIPPRESKLMRLTGKVVKSATAEGNGTLVLTFIGGDVLKLFDNSQQYESYTITYRGKEIFV